jgi:sugar phosphate isomerase/epimerase
MKNHLLRFCAALAVAGSVIAAPAVGTGSSFKGPVGLQLYSLRGYFTKSVPQGIELAKSFGIHDVELAGTYNFAPEKYRAMLLAAGLNPISAHVSYKRLIEEPEAVAAEAKALGLKYIGTAWIDHKGSFDAAQAHAAAAQLNRVGEIYAKHGLKCFDHCHGYEFEPGVAGPDTKAMDILIRETNPKFVTFQMDILWVTFPGEDPAAWLTKYPGRWELIHLKDLKKGVATGKHNGGTDPNNDVALGTGQMDWPKILAAAKKSRVKYYFIEDESATSAEQIPQTLKFLEQVKF